MRSQTELNRALPAGGHQDAPPQEPTLRPRCLQGEHSGDALSVAEKPRDHATDIFQVKTTAPKQYDAQSTTSVREQQLTMTT
jgi:hypothetical protein